MLKITTKKILFTLIPFIGLIGCGTSSNYYVLSVASQPSTVYANRHSVIGVEKITVPGYLYKREIAVAKTSSQISLLSGAVWGEDLDDGLTNRLISFLQKKFREPSVYAYPWNMDRVPTVKVKVQITRFIAQGERVYLDADWEVENMRTGKRKARLFSTTVVTKSDASSIVSSMDQAFKQLEESIANGIR
jgi:cholesterol transport system auxiliary component